MDMKRRDEGKNEEETLKREETKFKKEKRREEGRKVCLDKWSLSDGGLSRRFSKKEGGQDGQL